MLLLHDTPLPFLPTTTPPSSSAHRTDSSFSLPPPVAPSFPFLLLDVQVGDLSSLSPSLSPSPSSSSSSRHTLISPPSNFEHVYHMTSASAGAFLQKEASSSSFSSSQQSLLQPSSSSSSSPSISSLGRVGNLLLLPLSGQMSAVNSQVLLTYRRLTPLSTHI